MRDKPPVCETDYRGNDKAEAGRVLGVGEHRGGGLSLNSGHAAQSWDLKGTEELARGGGGKREEVPWVKETLGQKPCHRRTSGKPLQRREVVSSEWKPANGATPSHPLRSWSLPSRRHLLLEVRVPDARFCPGWWMIGCLLQAQPWTPPPHLLL